MQRGILTREQFANKARLFQPAGHGRTALTPGRTQLPAERPSRLIEVLANGGGVARADFVDFLPDVEAISQRRHSPAATWLVVLSLALLVAIVIWMAFSTVEQVATETVQRWGTRSETHDA